METWYKIFARKFILKNINQVNSGYKIAVNSDSGREIKSLSQFVF